MSAWKTIFDEFAPKRRAAGELSFQVFHVEDDRNDIALLMEWDDFDNAKAFLAGDELREAMGKTGVESEPVITFLNAGDSGKP